MSQPYGRSVRVRLVDGAEGVDAGVAIGRGPQASGSILLVDGRRLPARLEAAGDGRVTVSIGARSSVRSSVGFGRGLATPRRDGLTRLELVVDGWRFEVEIEDERRAALRERASRAGAATAGSGPTEVRAVIPGRVVAVSIAQREAIELGQQVLVVEAMKMQNELRSPRAGTVGRVAVAPGQRVEVGDLLFVIE